ncbi:hypothetical protein RV11_GL000733 [Enterococcus phoeniculicola]|nr:hypothetical protein RV11_GL000733 [Enterococcus phoeniculicola]
MLHFVTAFILFLYFTKRIMTFESFYEKKSGASFIFAPDI